MANDDDQNDNGPIEDQPGNTNLSPAEQQALGAAPPPAAPVADENSDADVATPDETPTDVPPDTAAAPDAVETAPPTPIAGAAAPAAPLPSPGLAIDQITNPTAQQMDQHNLAWYQDLANRHIEPKTYKDLFANKSTASQLGLAFSILLGGIGSGLTHQSNGAIDIMNKIIDRDFESQKQSKENANNFLRTEYEHQLQLAQQNLIKAQTAGIPISNQEIQARAKDLQADAYLKAQNATINNMKISMMQELNDTSDKLPPAQQQQAKNVINNVIMPKWTQEIQDANAKTAAQLQARSALRNSPQANQAQPQAPQAYSEQAYIDKQQKLRLLGMDDIANNNDARHLPGVGDASVPLSGGDREQINQGMQFQNQLQGFINWSRAHSGDLNPADMNEGRALAAQLQASYRNATNGGVYKEGEQNFIGKIISDDPTKFFNEVRSIPQLKAVQRESGAQLNQVLKSKGFQNSAQVQPTWSAQPRNKAGVPNATPPDGTKGTANGKPFTWKNGKRVYD